METRGAISPVRCAAENATRLKCPDGREIFFGGQDVRLGDIKTEDIGGGYSRMSVINPVKDPRPVPDEFAERVARLLNESEGGINHEQ